MKNYWSAQFVIALLISYGSAFASGNEYVCYSKTLLNRGLVASHLEDFLNCISGQPQLSQLGAQWIFLRKAHWRLVDGVSAKTLSSFQFASNPMDPAQANKLVLNLSKFSNDLHSIQKFIDELQHEIFPEIMRENKTSLSYASTMYQLISFMDTPLEYWKKTETAKVHYVGALLESEKFPDFWFDEQLSKFPVLQWLVNKDVFWSELRAIMHSYYKECDTACFVRQERKIFEALMAGLEHPQFFYKVHLEPLSDFGPLEAPFAGVQANLPRQYGCYQDFPFEDSPTGIRSYDFSLQGEGEQGLNFTQFGKWGLLGRPLYIEAINKNDINSSVARVTARHNGREFDDAPAHYMGQNAIIRDISEAAVHNLIQMGGLGGSRDVEASNGRLALNSNKTVGQVVDEYLRAASWLFADYQRKKYLGEDVSRHPVKTEAFFTETIISKGHSLSTWADILHKLNPPVFYHIFAYDYEFRPREGEPWRSYFDRVQRVLETKFEPTSLF